MQGGMFCKICHHELKNDLYEKYMAAKYLAGEWHQDNQPSRPSVTSRTSHRAWVSSSATKLRSICQQAHGLFGGSRMKGSEMVDGNGIMSLKSQNDKAEFA